MQGSLRVHIFTPVCVHDTESYEAGRSAMKLDSEKVTKPMKHKWCIPNAFGSSCKSPKNDATNKKDGDHESDLETFATANSSELHSIGTDDGSAELPSLPLSSLIFPTGTLGRPPTASPVKIVKKLPFGYVIGRQPDAPSMLPVLARNIKKVLPVMAAVLHLRSRSKMVKNKVARALKGAFRRARDRRGSVEEDGIGGDEDVFWKKDVRGLRCRRVEEDDDYLS